MEKLYTPELNKKETIHLSPNDREAINNITLGIEEVDDNIRSFAVESGDIINTLENGHPLNRLIKGEKNETIGYIACEDFIPHEAYVKYLGTNASTGRNLLSEIPAFIEYAKDQGYSKLNFHGWNNRLNNILTRYGFERIRTDNMASYLVDFYEKPLVEQKSKEEITQARVNAFEDKFKNKIKIDYTKTLASFKEDIRAGKEKSINTSFETITNRVKDNPAFSFIDFNERAEIILKLKLARYFQQNDSIDVNVLLDAIAETPNFIQTDKGGLHRLFEIHEQKTLQKIAEMRKIKTEQGDGDFNPYESLFETESGNYYMARLLNMPHLKEESVYMNHCVGTSDSYINKMKRGEVEILSFRKTPTIDKKNNKLNTDTPLITFEYNIKTKTIEQMKKYNDEYLLSSDVYYSDVIDALKNLRATKTDKGEMRAFKKINESELQNFQVKDYHILTENGEVHFRDFNPDENVFVLKYGVMSISPDTSKIDASKILQIVENIKVEPDKIAYEFNEQNENTKILISNETHYNSISSETINKLNSNIKYFTNSLEKTVIWQDIKNIDYVDLKDQKDTQLSYMLNPEKLNTGFEKMKPKILFKDEWVGRNRAEIFKEVLAEYGDKYYIPGIEYNQWLRKNPEKIPIELKDKNYYYMPQSPVFDDHGDANVVCGNWVGSEWDRSGYWLDAEWYSDDRILLLER